MPLTRRNFPVARDEGLLVEHLGDETVVYDSRTKDAHCLSPLAAVVFARCDGRTRVEDIAAGATERLGEPVDEARVQDALAQLEARGLLTSLGAGRNGVSRRELFRKGAAVGAVAASAPLITTIMVPTPAAAASATCGAALCCPCSDTDGVPANDQTCCDAPDATPNCNCTARNAQSGNTCKQCKVTSAATESNCLAEFGATNQGCPPNFASTCICVSGTRNFSGCCTPV